MDMKAKCIALLLVLIFAAGICFAQQQEEPVSPGTPVAENIGVDAAQQKLKEISVIKFEDPAFFYTSMPRDQGFVLTRRLVGSPIEKEPIEDEEAIGLDEADNYVLGVKVHYERRGMNSFAVMPVKPLPIAGVTKTISVWVAGRNNNHMLSMMILDYFGNPRELTIGKLNFSGWKKLTVAVPPNIIQKDYHYTNINGIKFAGLRVDCDPVDTYGSYYVYFDDLRAVTDLFTEESRDVDDMSDGW